MKQQRSVSKLTVTCRGCGPPPAGRDALSTCVPRACGVRQRWVVQSPVRSHSGVSPRRTQTRANSCRCAGRSPLALQGRDDTQEVIRAVSPHPLPERRGPVVGSSSLPCWTLSWRIISTRDTSGQMSMLHMGRVFRINEVQNFRVPVRNGVLDKLLLLVGTSRNTHCLLTNAAEWVSTCFNRWISLVSDQHAQHWSPVCCQCLVAKSCLTLGNPMDYSTPSFPVLHSLVEFA